MSAQKKKEGDYGQQIIIKAGEAGAFGTALSRALGELSNEKELLAKLTFEILRGQPSKPTFNNYALRMTTLGVAVKS